MNAKETVERDLIKARIRRMTADNVEKKIEALEDEQDLKRSLEFLEWLEDRNEKLANADNMENASVNVGDMCVRGM